MHSWVSGLRQKPDLQPSHLPFSVQPASQLSAHAVTVHKQNKLLNLRLPPHNLKETKETDLRI